MNPRNRTLATEFILLGFSNDLKINLVLFVVFMFLYLVSINANCLILCLVLINNNLHIQMYFFLCILSIIDMCMTSAILPRFLVDLISGQRIISLAACKAQFYVLILIGVSECLLLALMAYDRYVAICRPLHYLVLMRWSKCYGMTAIVWILSFVILLPVISGNYFTLCYPNQINHFMCEGVTVLHLSCSDIHSKEVFVFMCCFMIAGLPFFFILASYIRILFSVLKVKSSGRAKAFSTCSSHVMVVVLYYGISIVVYIGPSSKYSADYGKYFSLFSVVICPTLNPLIYCLNNKDVKEAQRN
ncbi:hypothetical protein GDO81_023053, partial [Engystomops pustulosus]